ncbi:nucleotidyltransferase domain-containing protein [Demequina capsici]|uniref:Nucleotidyltransferase domain-containing protein n=1 Tax=Demequina capsici TaxID=3075620 RepID=A0AA96J6S2_9MICO|nr:nucleotidyltransferase domain-containing protein [Demequina sp. OYTSA14]WNM23640.1 nucleotidyltransferase domain-containing protein [Demequina sp. OYTSA14]
MEHVILFGSWASRVAGVEGAFSADVDVLLVGSPNKLDAFDVAEELGDRLGREVQVTVMTQAQWNASEDRFVRDIKAKPFLEVA